MKPLNGHSGTERFKLVASLFQTLDLDTIGNLVGLGADIVMLVDDHDVVARIFFADRSLELYGLGSAVGKPLRSLVTMESAQKIDSMLSRDPDHHHPAKGYQVNHRCDGKPDLPVVYTAHSGKDFPYTLVVGRDLRQQMQDQQRLVETQMELEADYRELQEAETRYRTAFKVSAIPHLMLDGEKKIVLDANAAAISLLSNGNSISGKAVRELFHKQDRDRLIDSLGEARHSGSTIQVDDLRGLKGDRLSASLRSYRENGVTNLILSVWPAGDKQNGVAHRVEKPVISSAVSLADLPEAALQTDQDGQVLAANTLFLDLIHAPALSQVVGRNVSSWFAKSAIDMRVLYARVLDERTVRSFSSILTDNLSGERSVSVSARLNPDNGSVQLIIIPQGAGTERIALQPSNVPDQAEGFANLVGKVPLKDLIRESLDVIEKICIEAALDQTNNNRAYAAEILGLSRQSLYIKLRRHGLEDYRPGTS
ncbi:transcriptional regulator PpsR [Peteryoungia desertarenae]|uniref:Transcriptional regulator PpsR n=1 Tax=Peteryoungia desertarenae TaxID=1813451 RepID=A0ABX6QIV9_9HYPH|nr:transcriptional regulator PpsR [Peteryoungia desertarenae]QLF68501.1 transcriptional regulator PpsR [Peteryoungia desertarenae]